MFTKLNYVHEAWFLSDCDKGLFVHKKIHGDV